MIYELLYTSVPKGLKPGAKGYCTVLTTEGIPSALLERLESYCGYRHLFDPGSPDNPVAYGHRVLNLAGNTWHILSRVADAGTDYSGRSNLIGHFMAISQDELKGISAGPTSLMMSPGLFRKELVGEPRRVSEAETSKRLVGVMDRPQKAVTWNMVTGDAGWAGKLVQTTEESNESVSLVYPLRTNTLKLLDEAVSILPKNKQWDITFNTFFTKSGEECRWRCYCANVPEAVPFKGSEFDLVDVKRKGLDPGDGVYVGASREGKKMAGGVAKATPPLSNNAKLNTGKSVEAGKKLANIRKGKQEVELVKQEEAEFISVVKKSIDVLPRKTGSVPPPVQREEHFNLLEEDLADGRKTVYRKQQSENPYKTALIISVPVLLFIILLLIGRGIFVNLNSQSKPKSDLVVLEKTNSKKDSDVTTDIKPILTKGMHDNNSPLNSTGDTFEPKVKEKEEEAKKLAEAKEKEKERKEEAKKLVEAKEKEKEKEAKKVAQKEKQEKDAKDKGSKENDPTVMIARQEIEGNLILPLDTHLKKAIKNEVEFGKIKESGITVNLPDGIKIEGDLAVKYFCKSKAKIEIDQANGNKFHVKIPSDLRNADIESFAFAFSRISSKSIIQFFEPLLLKKNKEPGRVDSIRFFTDENSKLNLFKDWINNKERLELTEIRYHCLAPYFFMSENDKIVNNKNIKSPDASQSTDYYILVKPHAGEKTIGIQYVLSFLQFTYFVPVVFKEISVLEGDLKRRINITPLNLYQKSDKNDAFENYQNLSMQGLFDRKGDGGFIHEYYFNYESDKKNISDVHIRLGQIKTAFEGINRDQDTFGRPLLNHLKKPFDDSNVKLEFNKVLDQYVSQINQIQKYTNGLIPNFLVYYSLQWKDNKEDPENTKNHEYYRDAKILVYSYKQDL